MPYLKRNSVRFLCIGLLILLLIGCWRLCRAYERTAPGSADTADGPSAEDPLPPYLSPTVMDRTADAEDATLLALDESDGDVTITEGGTYRLTGRLDGTLYIRAEEQPVHLLLDGAVIHSSAGPAVQTESAGKVVITLLPDTFNAFGDSGDYRGISDAEGCVESACDLTVNGSGTLSIFGGYKDGIHCRDTVKLLGGEIDIQSKRSAIHGSDGIYLDGAMLTAESEKYGLKTSNAGPDGRGDLILAGGEAGIVAGRYALVCEEADLYIRSCAIVQKSVIDAYLVGGSAFVQEGCLQ